MFSDIRSVRVQEVIMSGSVDVIGNIRWNELGDGKPAGNPPYDHLPQAKPLFSFLKQYPTVNEVVHIMDAPKDIDGASRKYYFSPVNINGAINHNACPIELSEDEYNAETETSLDYFKEIYNIRPLQPYLGDITLEGRYGNSIRFGSTISGSDVQNDWSNEGDPGNPITIISNGQTEDIGKAVSDHILENINGDNSSIYLCSNQKINNFQKSGVELENYELSYKHML